MSAPPGAGSAALRITDALSEICAALGRDLDVGSSAAAIVDLAMRHAGARLACIHHIPGGPGALRLVACRGASPELEGALRSLPEGGASLVTRSARSRAIESISTSDPGAAELADARAVSAHGRELQLISMPLLFCDQLVGVLTCGFDEAVKEGSVAHSALRAFVGVFAITHARAIDCAAERRRLAELEALRVAAMALSRPMALRSVLQSVADEARVLTGAQLAALGIAGPSPDAPFEPWVHSGVSDEQVRAIGRHPRPAGLLAEVIRTGQPVRVADVTIDPRHRGVPPSHPPIKGFLGMPIEHDGHVVGELFLANKGDEPFTEEDERVTSLLAMHAALAIDRASAYERTIRDSQELRRAKDSLEISEERLNRTIEESPIGMALVALDGRFIRVNRVLCELLGYPAEELVRLRFQDITHPEDLDADLAQMTRLLQGEIDRYQLDKRYVRKDGSIVEIMLSGSIVRDRSGAPAHFIAQIEDVTEHKRVERALRDRERQFRGLFENALEAICILDKDGRFIDVNPAATALMAAPRAELLGRRLQEFATSEESLRAELLWQKLLDEGELTGEIALRTADGRTINVELSARAHFVAGRHLLMLRDVTARKRAESALRRSEERFRQLIEQASDAVFIANPEGRYTEVNPSACRMLGYSREELIGKTILDLIPAEDEPRLAEEREIVLAGGTRVGEWLLRHKAGFFLPVEVSTKMLSDGRWLAFVRDITERRRATEALTAERRWLQTVIERSPVGIVLSHDPKGTRITANRRAEELFRELLSPEGGIAQYLGQICSPDGAPLDVDDLPTRRALRGETTIGRELLLRRHDGSGVPVLVSAGPILDERGQLLGAVMVYEDLTRIKELERLREEWTAMVAHDLRQPVTSILGYATLLARRSEGADRAKADHILSSAQRLNRMIGDLMDASSIEARRLVITKKPTDLAALVRAVAERCATEIRGHPVEVEIRGALPRVDVDPGRLEQILGNLISNAAKYGYPDTEVRVTLERRRREVEIAVENHGPGIDPEDLARLFTRFQRGSAAKTQIVGVGLGLYITRGLVEAHGGRIWAESTPGERTIFRFTLPLAAEGGARADAAA